MSTFTTVIPHVKPTVASPDVLARPAPREVFCIIDDITRDRELASQVVSGRFTHAGRTLALGTTPNWAQDPYPADEEWGIEWNKFYFGLDLAHAYRQTGDPAYASTWERLVTSWIQQVPIGRDSTDVTARRIQNWTYAWSRFAQVPGFARFSQPTCEAIQRSIGEQAMAIRSGLSAERNHRTLELYALFIASIAHPKMVQSEALLEFSVAELYRNLCSDFLADGVHRELSTHYHAIVLRSFVGLRINAGRFGVDLPADFDERLQKGLDFLTAVIRPDGSLPMLSDSDDADHRDLLELASVEFERGDYLFVASGGKSGTPPERTIDHFPDGGYHILRSGWGGGETPAADELHMVFDCGPVGDSGHGHYDALHLELSGRGGPLLMDPGRYTYSEDDADGGINWRHYFKGTAAHNTVTVDGLDQTPYRRGKPKPPLGRAHFLGSTREPKLVSLSGEAHSATSDVIHRRQVLFVENKWFVVDDNLISATEHQYDLRWHLAPAAFGAAHLQGSALTAPELSLKVFSSHELTTELEAGFVAPTYGVKLRAPVLVGTQRARNARFLTVIAPDGDPTPEIDGALGSTADGWLTIRTYSTTHTFELTPGSINHRSDS